MINPGTPRIQSSSGTIRYLLLAPLCSALAHSGMAAGPAGLQSGSRNHPRRVAVTAVHANTRCKTGSGGAA